MNPLCQEAPKPTRLWLARGYCLSLTLLVLAATAVTAIAQLDTTANPQSGHDPGTEPISSETTFRDTAVSPVRVWVEAPEGLAVNQSTDWVGVSAVVVAAVGIVVSTLLGLHQIRRNQRTTEKAQKLLIQEELKSEVYQRLANEIDGYRKAVMNLSDALKSVHFRLAMYADTGYGAPTERESSLLDLLAEIQVPQVQNLIQSYAIFLDDSDRYLQALQDGERRLVEAFRSYYQTIAPFLTEADRAREAALKILREAGLDGIQKSLTPRLETFESAQQGQISCLMDLSNQLQERLIGGLIAIDT